MKANVTGRLAFPVRIGVWGCALLVATPVLGLVFTALAPPSPALSHFWHTLAPDVIRHTLMLMIGVGGLTLLIGVPCAWLVSQCRFFGSRLLSWLLLLPMAMPAYIIGYAYSDALTFAGPVQSLLREATGWRRGDYWFPDLTGVGGVIFMLSFVLYPYVYLMARSAFLDASRHGFETARSLGQGPWAAFFRVALPLARPAVLAGVALALMETLADFATVQYFGVSTFTTLIYRSWMGHGDRIAAAQLALLLLGSVCVLLAVERVSRGNRRYAYASRSCSPSQPFVLTGVRSGLAMLVCLLPVLLGFFLPVLMLVRLYVMGGEHFLSARFLLLASHSLLLALVSAAVITAVSVLLAYALRLWPRGLTAAAIRLATMGYAIPGTVLAVGVLIPLGMVDGWLGGLVLSGTLLALLFAYVVRFLAVGFVGLDAGFSKLSTRLDDVARTLGASQNGVLAQILLPLLRRPLLAALLLVFVDVLKELPATLIVRPFNFDTLAVRVYQMAADERLAQASSSALLIVMVALLPVLMLVRSGASPRGSV